jgi:pSer/pThr/pTyr-binding forkhead associated (FHA) protein
MDPISQDGTPDRTKFSAEKFREACGGEGFLQLNVEFMGRQDSTYRVLYQPYALLGRDQSADVILDHVEVNRRHAYLQQLSGRLYCIDLDTRHGTYWIDGRRPAGWLDTDQAVRIGPYWIRPYVTPSGNGNSEKHDSESWDAPPLVTVEVIQGSTQSRVWKMTPVLVLAGRSKNCRMHLVGSSVSNYHCSFVRTPKGVWVVDLLGRGGTLVNDMPVRCCRLDENDWVRVGAFRIRIHYDDSQTKQLPAPYAAPSKDDERTHSQATSPIPQVPAVSVAPSTPSLEESPMLGTNLGFDTDMVEALLAPFARQMAQAQQQMFDQFQQNMMMMFQMFSSMQRDQAGVIREELEHLRRLNEELCSLQKEMLAASPKPPALSARVGPVAERPMKNLPQATAPQPARPIDASVHPAPIPATPAANPEPRTAPQHPDTHFHELLTSRIMSLQKERQSRWQKIVNFLGSKAASGS